MHVLGTPPALILSQDQTLQLNADRRREVLPPRRGRELKRYYLVLRLNLASDLCARHLVFKEPPDLREPDQNIEIARYVSSNFERPALRNRLASWGVTTGVTDPRERYDPSTANPNTTTAPRSESSASSRFFRSRQRLRLLPSPRKSGLAFLARSPLSFP